MADNKPPVRIGSLKSIDSVLDVPPPGTNTQATPNRPKGSSRPSWIGPPRASRPATPGVAAMKQPVTVEYASPGLKPPVYICTSLSEPAWEPVEMEADVHQDGSFRFHKSFDAEEGEYQYKFRIGPGDWWAWDVSKPVVNDEMGNKNNLLIVKPAEKQLGEPTVPAIPSSPAPAPASASSTQTAPRPPSLLIPKPALATQALDTPHVEAPPPLPSSHQAPLLEHEKLGGQSAASEHTPEAEARDLGPLSAPEDADAAINSKDHESFSTAPQEATDNNDEDEDDEDNAEEESSSSSSTESDDDENDEKFQLDPHDSPLLPHEKLTPISSSSSFSPQQNMKPSLHSQWPQTFAPKHPSATKPHLDKVVPQEADENDPSLERFPTDYVGLVTLMRRIPNPSPPSQDSAESSASAGFLPGVPEDEDETDGDDEDEEDMLGELREAEEEELEIEEASGERIDPLKDEIMVEPDLEPEDAEFEPDEEKELPHPREHPKAGHQMQEAQKKIVSEINSGRNQSREEPEDKVVAMLGGRDRAVAVAVGLLVVAVGIALVRFW